MVATVRKKIKKVCSFIIASIFFFNSTLPVHSLSIQEERDMGEKLFFQVRQTFPLIEDPDISQYINSLGDEVLSVTGVQYFNYHFSVINSDQFNAFAIPAGLIFFYSGLIVKMDTENELVAVMAHEIGHVVKRHIASSSRKNTITGVAALAVAILGAAIGGSGGSAVLTGALATGQSVNLHFSRENEQEADLLAYKWMRKLHRNPEGEVDMLGEMRRIARYRSEKLPQYLLTHPNPEERMDIVESFIDTDGPVKNTRIIDNFNFLRFKYRLLSMTEDSSILNPYFSSLLSQGDATPEIRVMAEYGMSQVNRQENDFKHALQLIDKVIAAYPDKTILQVDKAIIESEAGDNESALLILQNAVQKDSSDMYGTFALASVLKKMGRLKDAQYYFEIVSEHIPEYAKVYFELGEIASQLGNNSMSLFYLAQSNLYEGKIRLAKETLKQIKKDEKKFPKEVQRKINEMDELIKRIDKK